MSGKYTTLSLFSGAMGLDLGVGSTERFHLLACIEKNHACCETIRHNLKAGRLNKDLKVFEGDIAALPPEKVLDELGMEPGELDLLVGGPPCQAFSTAGKRKSLQDPRGTLIWQFLRYVEVLKPKFFLMENVRGLLSAALRPRPRSKRPDKGGPPLEWDENPGSVVKAFVEDLLRISGGAYRLDCFDVNSVNYGAPQSRGRVLLIGNRFKDLVDLPKPTHGPNVLPWLTLGDAIGDLKEDAPVVLDFSPRKKKYLSMVPEGLNWRSLPEAIQKESMGRAWFAKGGRTGWWRRLDFGLPCPTLLTMPNHASTSLCHPTETRALSLREYARIQEFPDSWEFKGTVSQRYAQIGNAVPVRLGQVSGGVIAEHLDTLKLRRWRPYEKTGIDYRLIKINPTVKTR